MLAEELNLFRSQALVEGIRHVEGHSNHDLLQEAYDALVHELDTNVAECEGFTALCEQYGKRLLALWGAIVQDARKNGRGEIYEGDQDDTNRRVTYWQTYANGEGKRRLITDEGNFRFFADSDDLSHLSLSLDDTLRKGPDEIYETHLNLRFLTGAIDNVEPPEIRSTRQTRSWWGLEGDTSIEVTLRNLAIDTIARREVLPRSVENSRTIKRLKKFGEL